MISLAVVIGLLAVIGSSNAVTIGDFRNVTGGVYNAWQTADPQNVQGRFATIYGNDHLYLISKRRSRNPPPGPYDPASRGGIVSTYSIPNDSWTHKPYDRLESDPYGDELFSLGGRLFMLTYSRNERRIGFHKLFSWDYESGQWLETPFEIDPTASTITDVQLPDLSISVPDPNEPVAYLVSSAPRHAQAGSEFAFSRLDVDFRGNVPVKANLKSIGHYQTREPSSVVFTALNNGSLYALFNNYYSEGPVRINDKIVALDLKSNIAYVRNLKGDLPISDFWSERIFQFGDQVLIVGGERIRMDSNPDNFEFGQFESVNNIWSLDLSSLQWMSTNGTISNGVGSGFALDQKNGKLYAAGLEQGIHVASVSDQ